jgi:hypothetical protein
MTPTRAALVHATRAGVRRTCILAGRRHRIRLGAGADALGGMHMTEGREVMIQLSALVTELAEAVA